VNDADRCPFARQTAVELQKGAGGGRPPGQGVRAELRLRSVQDPELCGFTRDLLDDGRPCSCFGVARRFRSLGGGDVWGEHG